MSVIHPTAAVIYSDPLAVPHDRATMHDLLDWAPEPLNGIIRRLREEAEDARAAYVAAQDRWQDAQNRHHSAFLDVQRLQAMYDRGTVETVEQREGYLGEQTRTKTTRIERDERRMEREHARLARLRADVDSAARRRDAAGEVQQAARGTLDRAETYLKSFVPGTRIEMHEGAVKLPKAGTDPRALVDSIRAEIEALIAEKGEIETAPIPSAKAKEIARRQIEDLARRGAPQVFGTIEHGDPVKFPEGLVASSLFTGNGQQSLRGTGPDGVALIAWLHRDEILARIEADIDRQAADDRALDDDTRETRLAATVAKILEAERREEAAIQRAAETGIAVPRRANADVRAVLGLATTMPHHNGD